jgi:hypothetical protein
MAEIVSRNQFTITSLEALGDQERLVANQFIQQKENSRRLALIYPGMGYSCDRPLLYFTTELFLSRGFDVLQLWSNYETPEFDQLSQSEKTIRLIADGKSLLISARQAGTYRELLLCGKSLGTLTMAFMLNEDQQLRQAATIWFTPLIHLPPVAQAIQETKGPAFIAGSQADETFSAGPVEQLKVNPKAALFITDNADHSLEIPGDTLRSLEILNQVIGRLAKLIR